MLTDLLSFPNPVNEKAARTVAAVVSVLTALTLATSAYWLTVVLAYGFLARVATGPTLSPLGRLASAVIAPRLGPEKPVPGPPKRFAQGMGAAFSVGAATAALGFGDGAAADALLALVLAAAFLEAAFGLCLGCKVFALLMRAGIVPERACVECADIWSGRRAAETGR
ncbi:MAG TPA: DUF4395 domain-containing protein [Solirubrobacteraceae bacterium]|nr:DUF4395 domain-containing protein [Solirubrobacteraceae bacterium]